LIDIHSHVLYGMDDGARTLEDSLAMLRMAAEHGTTDLIATPHASPSYRFDPDQIARQLDEISAALHGAIRLYSGCDFHLSYENIQDAINHPQKYTLDHKNYLLVEFSDLLIFRNTADIFDRLTEAGMIPVITHPERNSLLRQRLEPLTAWVEAGALVQVTAQSVIGDFGRQAKEFCQVLLDRGLVHFVASDAHDLQHRPPRLDLVRAWLAENRGEAVSEALCVANPRAALTGQPLQGFSTGVVSESRKWYHFWR
jgi:protein-tyrosine phosphatase